MKRPHILYLVPDLFGPPGGIARHGRTVCEALIETQASLSVLALMDEPGGREKAANTLDKIRYQPCNGDRALFVRRGLQAIKERPSLVLVEHPNLAPLGWIIARLCNAKLVVVAHGIDIWPRLSASRRRALQKADLLLCVSAFTARKACQSNGISPSKTRVLHNCLEPVALSNRPPENKGHLSLLTVARISLAEQYKGHDYVIRALPTLLRSFPELTYDVVGDGDGKRDLEILAESLEVERNVRFHGKVTEDELTRCYERASVFVMPSRGEGFGIAFLEAMSYGVPVIGGNMDASPEVILDGETGYVIDPTSVDELVDKTSHLLGDAELRARMGQNAITRVADCFSFQRFQQQLVGYLAEVQPNFGPVS